MPSIIPNPGVYGQAQASALQAYNNALSSIQQQRGNLLTQSGLTANVGPSGQYSDTRVDPYAQYGAYQTMRHNQGTEDTNAMDSSFARGIGGSGLGAQAETGLKYQHGQQENQFGENFLGGLSDLSTQQNQAANTYNASTLSALQTALAQAIATQNFTPAAVKKTRNK